MADYEIRYLKPDGSSKKVTAFEAASDTEAYAYVVEYHGRRPTELWREDQILHRRVSPKFLAANKGIYPSRCRWPAMSEWSLRDFAKHYPSLTDSEFEMLGRQSENIFQAVAAALAPHPISLWASGFGPPRPKARQAVRFTSFPSIRDAGDIVGYDICTVFSDLRDGPDIVDDLDDLLRQTLKAGHQRRGIADARLPFKVGADLAIEVDGELCKPVTAYWRVASAGATEGQA